MIINFNINNQHLTKGEDTYLVNLSKNYLKCTFHFNTEDWDGLIKYITFNSKGDNYRFPLNRQETLTVPNDLLKYKYFYVKAYGLNEEEEVIITTNDVVITLDTVDNNPLLAVPTNDSVEEIINYIGAKINRKVDRFELKGRKLICYTHDTPIQIIPINDETVMNVLNEYFIDVNVSELTEEGLLFYKRYNL